jgi:hypothetical protein
MTSTINKNTVMVDIKKLLEEIDSLSHNEQTGDIELIKSIPLTIDEINSLSIDNLLDLKHRNISIKINSNNSFNIRWKDDGFDIAEERTDEIETAIKALLLKIKVENAGAKFYKNSVKDIVKLGDKIDNKILLSKILDLDFKNVNLTGSKQKADDSIGFSDIFNIINQVTVKNKNLNTLGGKADYIINKLELTDITEVVYAILTIAVVTENSNDE